MFIETLENQLLNVDDIKVLELIESNLGDCCYIVAVTDNFEYVIESCELDGTEDFKTISKHFNKLKDKFRDNHLVIN